MTRHDDNVSLRQMLGYDAVDNDFLWEIVTADFPSLAKQIQNLLPAEKA